MIQNILYMKSHNPSSYVQNVHNLMYKTYIYKYTTNTQEQEIQIHIPLVYILYTRGERLF